MGASITLIPSLPSLSSRSGIRLEVEKGSSDPGGEPASVGLYIHDIRVCGIAVRADDGKEEKVRRQSNAKDGLTVMLTIV